MSEHGNNADFSLLFISGRFLSLVGLREEYLVDELADELVPPAAEGASRCIWKKHGMFCFNTKR